MFLLLWMDFSIALWMPARPLWTGKEDPVSPSVLAFIHPNAHLLIYPFIQIITYEYSSALPVYPHSWLEMVALYLCNIIMPPLIWTHHSSYTKSPQRCYSFKYVSPSSLWHPLCSRCSLPSIWRGPLVVRQKFSLGTGPGKGSTLSWTLGGVTQASGAHVPL